MVEKSIIIHFRPLHRVVRDQLILQDTPSKVHCEKKKRNVNRTDSCFVSFLLTFVKKLIFFESDNPSVATGKGASHASYNASVATGKDASRADGSINE